MQLTRSLPATYWPATRHLLGLASLALLALTVLRVVTEHQPGFGDVYAYHEAWNVMYDGAVGGAHAYLYSPAFAQAIWPLTLLPFWAFYGLLLAANVGALVFLVGWRWAGWVAALFYPVTLELGVGNIHLLLAASMVLAIRQPAWWAFSLLTKVTSGVGLLYELWRPKRFMLGAGVTLAIVAVSTLLAPNLWVEWFTVLRSSSGVVDPWALVDVPLLSRLPVAVGIVLVAGWRRWEWLVPVACLVAMPVIWVGSVVLLLAVVPLLRSARQSTADDADTRHGPRSAGRDKGGRQRVSSLHEDASQRPEDGVALAQRERT